MARKPTTRDASNEELDFRIDTEKANKKYAARRNNPYRIKEGIFRLPKGLSQSTLERAKYEKCGVWIRWLGKQGWELKSELKISGPHPATEMGTDGVYGAVVLDLDEWRVRGVFSTVPKPTRLEVPSDLVKRDAHERLTAKQAAAALSS